MLKRVIPFVFILALVFACGPQFVKPAYDSAAISKTAYDTALTAMGSLHKQGVISDAVKDQAIKYGKLYQIAHNGAVEALARFVESSGDADRQAYLNASVEAAKTLLQLLNYCTPYIAKGGNP